jgi:hypothetical protein
MKSKVVGAAAGIALAVAAGTPAEAQFMSNYPAVIIVPPPAQSLVMPKPAPKTSKPTASEPPSVTPPPNLSQCYQGRARVCQ